MSRKCARRQAGEARGRGLRGIVAVAALLAAPVLETARGGEVGRTEQAGGPSVTPVQAVASESPPVELPPNLPEGWYATVETSLGTIVARLLPDQAPQAVAHFAALAEGRLSWTDPVTGEHHREPYYDGNTVLNAEAARRFEVGDRSASGRAATPFFVPPGEGGGPVDFSRPGRLGLSRGALNRINAGRFFVTAGSLPWLSPLHPCFGEVVSGHAVAWNVSAVRTHPSGAPVDPVTIRRVRIRKVGNPPPLSEPLPFTPKPDVFGLREDVVEKPGTNDRSRPPR